MTRWRGSYPWSGMKREPSFEGVHYILSYRNPFRKKRDPYRIIGRCGTCGQPIRANHCHRKSMPLRLAPWGTMVIIKRPDDALIASLNHDIHPKTLLWQGKEALQLWFRGLKPKEARIELDALCPQLVVWEIDALPTAHSTLTCWDCPWV